MTRNSWTLLNWRCTKIITTMKNYSAALNVTWNLGNPVDANFACQVCIHLLEWNKWHFGLKKQDSNHTIHLSIFHYVANFWHRNIILYLAKTGNFHPILELQGSLVTFLRSANPNPVSVCVYRRREDENVRKRRGLEFDTFFLTCFDRGFHYRLGLKKSRQEIYEEAASNWHFDTF